MTPEEIAAMILAGRLSTDEAHGETKQLVGVGGGDLVGMALTLKQAAAGERLDKGRMSCKSVLSDSTDWDRSREMVDLPTLNVAGWKSLPLGLYQHMRNCVVSRFEHPDTKQFTVQVVGKQLIGEEFFVQTGPMAQFAAQVFELIESGVLCGKSLGFLSSYRDYHRVPLNPDDVYGPANTTIKNCRVFEASSVYIPDNERSLVTQVVRKGLSGGAQLLPPLAQMLAPYATPAAAWSPGATLPPPPAPTPAPPASPPPVTKEAPVTTPAAIPPDIQAKADRADWYDKTIGKSLGLDLSGYAGRPTQKCLQGLHDAAMYSAVSALATAETVEGAAEQAITKFVQGQYQLAVQAVMAHKELFGTDPDWGAITPFDLVGPNVTGDREKTLRGKAEEWAARVKGWGKGHTGRIKAAADAVDALLANADPAKAAELRTKATAAVADLRGMYAENGKLLTVADRETDEVIKQLRAAVNDLGTQLAAMHKTVNAARAGRLTA